MRIFKYLIGGKWVTYEDADDVYSPEDIKAHWAATYPELSAATWDKTSGPNGEEIYTFAKKVGTKGGTKGVPDPNPELTKAIVQRLVLSEDYDDEQIEEILAQDETKSGDWPAWISTAERLPEFEADVLFCVQFEVEQFMFFGCMDRDDSGDLKWFSDLDDEFEPEDVTHWITRPPFPPVLPEPAAPEGPGYAVRKFTYNGFSGKTQRGFAPYRAQFVEWTTDPGVATFDCSDGERRLIPTFAIVDFDRTQHPAQPKSGVLFGQAARS